MLTVLIAAVTGYVLTSVVCGLWALGRRESFDSEGGSVNTKPGVYRSWRGWIGPALAGTIMWTLLLALPVALEGQGADTVVVVVQQPACDTGAESGAPVLFPEDEPRSVEVVHKNDPGIPVAIFPAGGWRDPAAACEDYVDQLNAEREAQQDGSVLDSFFPPGFACWPR